MCSKDVRSEPSISVTQVRSIIDRASLLGDVWQAYLFIYLRFIRNYAGRSDYIALTELMINELERMSREVVVAYANICLDGLGKSR